MAVRSDVREEVNAALHIFQVKSFHLSPVLSLAVHPRLRKIIMLSS